MDVFSQFSTDSVRFVPFVFLQIFDIDLYFALNFFFQNEVVNQDNNKKKQS